MRALFYPVVGLAAIAAILILVTITVAAINKWREDRAIAAAKWEPYATPANGGHMEIGVHLIARWGRNHKVLQRDNTPAIIPGDNLPEILDAHGRAIQRAETANTTRFGIQG
jgi:hypothetical protein